MKQGFIFAALLLMCGCKQVTIEDLISEARLLAVDGGTQNWKKAHRNLETCIKRGSTNNNTVVFYILCLYQNKNYDKALKVATEQLTATPDSFHLNYLLGKMCYDQDNLHKAFGYLRKSQILRPGHIDSLVLMANCAVKLRLPVAKDILTDLVKMKEFKNSYLAYNGLAMSFVYDGKYPQAMSTFSKALTLSGNHPLLHLNMAILSDQYLKKPEIAQRQYDRFIRSAKDRYPEHCMKARERLTKLTN